MENENLNLKKLPSDLAKCPNPQCSSHIKNLKTYGWYENNNGVKYAHCSDCGLTIKLDEHEETIQFNSFLTKEQLATEFKSYFYTRELMLKLNTKEMSEFLSFNIMQNIQFYRGKNILQAKYEPSNESCCDFSINNENYEVTRIFNEKQMHGGTHNEYLIDCLNKKISKRCASEKKPHIILFDLIPDSFYSQTILGQDYLDQNTVDKINKTIKDANQSIKDVYLFSNRYPQNNVQKNYFVVNDTTKVNLDLIQVWFFDGEKLTTTLPVYKTLISSLLANSIVASYKTKAINACNDLMLNEINKIIDELKNKIK